MSKEKLEVGDYVKVNGENYSGYGQIKWVYDSIDEVQVVESDGDKTDYDFEQVEFVEKEEGQKHLVYIDEFTDDYSAVIDFERNILHVGCQDIPFSKIKELYKQISNHEHDSPNLGADRSATEHTHL